MTENKIKRIAIIGPESSGKSALSRALASKYKTIWIPEHAREYLSQLDRTYLESDVITIYKEQWEQESRSINKANKFLFIDTEFIIGKVWYEHVYKKPCAYFDNMIKQYPYDFYLLTSPDLPWEADPLRENPGKGLYFFEWYKNILAESKLPYSIVSGTGDDRLQCAVQAINQHF
jgi:NadR type nicotinamide-nucleotide adenylyltransferase